MRVAVVSDIHSNLHALEAVLAAIDEEAPDELWCLGDLVGYGPRPNECCAAIAERADVCLAGNHDLAVQGTLDLEEFGGEAAVAARWTREVLAPEAQALLDRLEPQGSAHGIALYHGSARDPVWEYVLNDEAALATLELADAPLVLVGHSHVALKVVQTGDELEGGVAPADTELELGGVRALLNRARSASRATATRGLRISCSTSTRSTRASAELSTTSRARSVRCGRPNCRRCSRRG